MWHLPRFDPVAQLHHLTWRPSTWDINYTSANKQGRHSVFNTLCSQDILREICFCFGAQIKKKKKKRQPILRRKVCFTFSSDGEKEQKDVGCLLVWSLLKTDICQGTGGGTDRRIYFLFICLWQEAAVSMLTGITWTLCISKVGNPTLTCTR